MGTYVVGDIHGHFDEWISLKEKIESLDPDAVFILVGDILNRGPKTLEMLRWAMEHITQDGAYRMVLGDHEDLIIKWWKKYKKNKCARGHCAFYFDILLAMERVSESETEEMIAFFESLPIAIEMDVLTKGKQQHYIIAHASIIKEFLTDKGYIRYELLNGSRMICEREYGGGEISIDPRKHLLQGAIHSEEDLWKQDTILVHGHESISRRDLIVRGAVSRRIDFKEKVINVDCGVHIYDEYRNLAAIRLEDLEEFYFWEPEEEE